MPENFSSFLKTIQLLICGFGIHLECPGSRSQTPLPWWYCVSLILQRLMPFSGTTRFFCSAHTQPWKQAYLTVTFWCHGSQILGTWKLLGSCKNYRCLGPTYNYSALIGLDWVWTSRILKCFLVIEMCDKYRNIIQSCDPKFSVYMSLLGIS